MHRNLFEEYRRGMTSWYEAYLIANNKAAEDNLSDEEFNYWMSQVDNLASHKADVLMADMGYQQTINGEFFMIDDSAKGIKLIRSFREELLGSQKEEFLNKYNGNLKEYTKLFNKFISNLVEEHNSQAYNEYYRIDVTGWKVNEKGFYDSVKIYDWDFDYAIEYENDQHDWTYELLKLSFIRADVRIVVGYRDKNKYKRDDEIKIINKQLKHFKHPVAADEEFYVILMNMNPDDNVDPFDMKVYSIKEKYAVEITDCL